MDDRLYRSRDDRLIAGVAGGLAERWGADPSFVRILWALLTIFTGGLALLVYVIMAIVVPEEDEVLRATTAAGAVAQPGEPVDPTASAPAITPAPGAAPLTRYEARRARREARRAARHGGDGRTGLAIGGVVLIFLGSWFLLREWFPRIDFDWIWPGILIAIGVLIILMAVGHRPERPGGAA